MGDGFALQARAAEQEYRPKPDALRLAQLDERVGAALAAENAYWVLPATRMQTIKARCVEAMRRRHE